MRDRNLLNYRLLRRLGSANTKVHGAVNSVVFVNPMIRLKINFRADLNHSEPGQLTQNSEHIQVHLDSLLRGVYLRRSCDRSNRFSTRAINSASTIGLLT